jgi:uncharacterized Zn finger protein (UPF0148 family)
MSNAVFFNQHCPTCGRRLQIRVEYLGRRVVCPHCNRKLEASDPSVGEVAKVDPAEQLIRRADELLETADLAKPQMSKVSHPR